MRGTGQCESDGDGQFYTDLTVFGASQGLTGNVIDAGPDDAQNIWAVTPDALYLLQPGQTTFTRFTAADGLNITPFTDPNGQPTVSSITAVAGGRPGEVFVGYYGFEGVIPPPAPPSCCVPNADFSDPRWSVGQADKVTLNPNGTLQVRHYNFICDISFNCWEERSVRRMTFAHQGTAAGHLFIGFDHGVTHLFNDVFGDHIHVITLYHFTDGSRVVQKQGEQYGLFVAPNGDLLTGGAYGVGLQRWNPDPRAWVNESFVYAFTTYGPATSYNQGPNALDVPAGYREDQRGVALTPDGVAWMASLTHGLASFNGASIRPYTNVPGLPSSGLRDMTADPDGTAVAGSSDSIRLTSLCAFGQASQMPDALLSIPQWFREPSMCPWDPVGLRWSGGISLLDSGDLGERMGTFYISTSVCGRPMGRRLASSSKSAGIRSSSLSIKKTTARPLPRSMTR